MPEMKKVNHPQSKNASPSTDPTNPYSQEAAGMFLANEAANERRLDEPGLDDGDRERRAPGAEKPVLIP